MTENAKGAVDFLFSNFPKWFIFQWIVCQIFHRLQDLVFNWIDGAPLGFQKWNEYHYENDFRILEQRREYSNNRYGRGHRYELLRTCTLVASWEPIDTTSYKRIRIRIRPDTYRHTAKKHTTLPGGVLMRNRMEGITPIQCYMRDVVGHHKLFTKSDAARWIIGFPAWK